MAGSEGGPVRPKAKRAPQKPAQHRARKTKRLPEPSGDPRGHIQHWLVPGAAAGHTYQENCPPSVRELAQHPQACSGPRTGCSTEPWSGPGTIPAVPGSSTDPPPGGLLHGAHGPRPSDPGPSRSDLHLGGGGGGWSTQDGLQGLTIVGRLPREGAGALPDRDLFSGDEDFPPPLSGIPDFFVPFPRRWSLTRQPAACERSAPDRTVATLKRGPSLYLSIYLYIYIYIINIIHKHIHV